MSRHLPALASLIALLALAPAPAARAAMLEDSTTVEAWRLPNGLEVRVRNVPRAKHVAITVAYRAGTGIESPAQPELAALLAQVRFTAPVGDVPERTLEEMDGIRPLGWAVTTNPHLALLTETGTLDHLAGVLHEVAMRARGVQVTDSCLAHVRAAVRRDAASRRYGNVEPALYERVRDLGLGRDESQVLKRAGAAWLGTLTPAHVESLLARYYGASNASLALVGDFSSLDLRALVEREFGPVPAGVAQPDPPAERLAGAARVVPLRGVTSPAAVVGVIAPALEDPAHAAFYLNALIVGGWWSRRQLDAGSRLASHFQYSLLDEPEIVRYEDASSGSADTAAVRLAWDGAMQEYAQLLVTGDVHDLFRNNVRWMVGGPLSPQQRRQALDTPTLLTGLSTTTAARAIWKGDTFWAGWRRRLDEAHFGATSFLAWMTAPEHQVVLVLAPPR